MSMPDNIKVWVEALESENYKQQKGTLRGTKGFCCLGVYLDTCGVNIKEIDIEGNQHDDHKRKKHYAKCFEDIDPNVCEKGIDMNDDDFSFTAIAQMIRESYDE